VQPYHAGYEPLLTLDQLVRIDKHRALWLCGSLVESLGGFAIYRGDELAWRGVGGTRVKMGLAAGGHPLGPASDYRVEMEGKPTIFVSLKDFPSPPQTTNVLILRQILECVANVIPRLESFF